MVVALKDNAGEFNSHQKREFLEPKGLKGHTTILISSNEQCQDGPTEAESIQSLDWLVLWWLRLGLG